MTRKQNRYASNARNEVRISGQTIRGEQSTSLGILLLKELPEDATPAQVVRDALARAKAIAAGTLRPIASNEEIRNGRGVLPAVVRATGLF
jgi:hypothetical protein